MDQEKVLKWVAFEQQALWFDLVDAIHQSYNGVWSMAAETYLTRLVEIISATQWITRPESLPYAAITSGIYEDICSRIFGGYPEDLKDRVEEIHREGTDYENRWVNGRKIISPNRTRERMNSYLDELEESGEL